MWPGEVQIGEENKIFANNVTGVIFIEKRQGAYEINLNFKLTWNLDCNGVNQNECPMKDPRSLQPDKSWTESGAEYSKNVWLETGAYISVYV